MKALTRVAVSSLLFGAGALGIFSRAPADAESTPYNRDPHFAGTEVRVTQVVSFGDSLSDVGTYAFARRSGGGLYTTNPGQISVQIIAAHYGEPLKPAVTGGFSEARVSDAAGLGYAQGGARVSGPPNPRDETEDTGELQTPLTEQMAAFLAHHEHFAPNQLVIIQGGANDVQDAYVAWATAVESGGVAGGGDPAASLQAVVPLVVLAARQLADLVLEAREHGAVHIAILNVPDLGKTPVAPMLEHDIPGSTEVLRQLSRVFDEALDAALPIAPGIEKIDTFALLDDISRHYRDYGFSHDGSRADNVACGAAALPKPFAADADSALFCSPKTYVSADADQTYMFADAYHPTTHLQKLLAEKIIAQTDAALAAALSNRRYGP